MINIFDAAEPALKALNLRGNMVLLSQVGSRAYGTHNETSDYDFKGVYIEPLINVLDFRRQGYGSVIDVAEPDVTLYELSHFCKLAADANPTVLEILYSDKFETAGNKEGVDLRQIRSSFLSKKVFYTYGGYAMDQLKKAQRGEGSARGADHYKRTKYKLHTLRLLDAGVTALREGYIPVKVEDPANLQRLAELPMDEVAWFAKDKLSLMDEALKETKLPDLPDYAAINKMVYAARLKAI